MYSRKELQEIIAVAFLIGGVIYLGVIVGILVSR